MTHTFSIDDLLDSMDVPPTKEDPASLPINNKPPRVNTGKSKSFLTAQFPLLSTPYFILYLQGPAAWVDTITSDTTPQALLTMAFSNSKARKLGRNISPELAAVVDLAVANKAKFYTDKLWHKEMLGEFIRTEAKMDINKVGNKAFPLAAIDSYLDALAIFLSNNGYSTNSEYLALNSNSSNKTTSLSWDSVDLADL